MEIVLMAGVRGTAGMMFEELTRAAALAGWWIRPVIMGQPYSSFGCGDGWTDGSGGIWARANQGDGQLPLNTMYGDGEGSGGVRSGG